MPRRNVPIPPPARLSDEALAPLDDVTEPWPGRHVDVDGLEIFVRSTPPTGPAAQPALFVHGLGGSAHNWTDFAGLLRNRLDIEALDLPGFGRSGPAHSDDYRLQAHAHAVIRYLEVSGRGSVHLAGSSMGGAVCLLVASQRPDLLRSLTLVSPAVPDVKVRVHPLRSDPRMALLPVPVVGAAALRRMRLLPDDVRIKATIKLCFSDTSRYPQRRLAEAIAEAEVRRGMPWSDTAMLRSLRGLVRSQFFEGRAAWTAMRGIELPTLVLWGDADRLVAPDLAPLLAAAIPDARLLVLADVGHVAMMEDPQTSARAVLALLDDVAAERASAD
jgi:pimeloyl-ACP methyl ester carboxylesterase